MPEESRTFASDVPEQIRDADPLLPVSPPVDTTPVATVKPRDMTRESKLVIYLILVSAFVVMLNETIIGVALPSIMSEMGIDPSTGQWLLTAFMLTMAVVIPMSGFFLRRLSTRGVYFSALGLFTLGTVLAAIAPDFLVLLLGRILQAAGTGVMMPLLMTTIMTLVPPHERGRMMGNISIVMSVAPAIGPMISGLILNFFHWRMVFVFVIPIAIAAIVLAWRKLVNVTERERVGIDIVSIPLAVVAFGGLVYGLSETSHAVEGTALMPPWIPIVVGAAALALFLWRQLRLQREDRALIDLRTFTFKGFPIAILMLSVTVAILFGSIILVPIYVQDALGQSPLVSGLVVLPGSLIMGFAGPFVGRIYDRHGPKALVVPGSILVAGALWGYTFLLGPTTPVWVVAAFHIVLSLGLAGLFGPLMNSALGALEPRLYPSGSAIVGTIQQVAGAAGTAVFVVVYTLRELSALAGGASDALAVAEGSHAAFLAAACSALAMIVIAFFIRRPADSMHGPSAQ